MIQNEHQTRHVQMQGWEIGGELLDILSRGLYSDAKDALREYVQNGVDASARQIIIGIDGPQAFIRDDGSGMDEEGIRAARRFGVSQKSPLNMVGYRGIGLYSAFGICDEMIITSRQAGMPNLVGWRFQFGEMRRLLEVDKESDVRQGIGLPELMHQHTELFSEPYYGDSNDHFTLVELYGLGEEYSAQLNNIAEVMDYLLNTIPVAFPSGGYGDTINGWLKENAGLNSVQLSVRIGDNRELLVLPPVPTEVYEPEFGWIKAEDGTPKAFVWYGLSTDGRQLPAHNDSSISGFLMKVKGFTLGNRLTLKPLWPAVGGRTLYHHYSGEVHILDTARLYPNAARDDLESSAEKQQFSKLASDFFYPLSRKARVMQAKSRAIRLLEGVDKAIQNLEARRNSAEVDAFELYREGINYRTDLERVHQQILTHMRSPRGRPAMQIEGAQKEELDAVLLHLSDSIKQLGGVVRRAQQRTRSTSSKLQVTQPLPHVVLLERVLAATLSRSEESPNDKRLQAVSEALRPLVNISATSRVIGILDGLKASGLELGADVEACRKELRSSIGWSPLAPVSLEEALGQYGFSIDTSESSREESLINAIDQALVVGLGGRGEMYENVLQAIAESVVEEFGG